MREKFKSSEILDNSILNMMTEWRELIQQQQNNEDTWTVIPELPLYNFKNLQIESNQFETTDKYEMTITYKYDDFQFHDKNL